jgi:hypothetical protein
MRAAFLDYDTVSNGDLDTASLKPVVDELLLFDINEPKMRAQTPGADIVLVN